MIKQLQIAYEQGLGNLVFVDFKNKVCSEGANALELEISKEKACCKDLITAINLHFCRGDYDVASERIEVLGDRIEYIKHLENQVKEQRRNKLFDIANQLGETAKVVKFNVNSI